MCSRSNGSPPVRWRRRRTLDFWRGSSAAATRGSERIVDAAEYRGPAAGKAEIQVADDEGIRHAAQAEPRGSVQFRERARAERREHLAGIEERGHLHAHPCAEAVEVRDGHAQLQAGSEQIASEEADGAVAAHRLATDDHT